MTTFARIALSAIVLCACGETEQACTGGYDHAWGNIEIGAELYYDIGGGTKQFAGRIVQISDNIDFGDGQRPERGVLVRLTDGDLLWRKRRVLLNDEWLVKC